MTTEMIYDNSRVRRQEHVMPEARAREILRTADYGFLAMADGETGGAYGIPVSYVWDGESAIYIHCAPQGRKITDIEANGSVSFCVVGHTRVIPDHFSTERESIVLFGRATADLDAAARNAALRLLVDKYSMSVQQRGYDYAAKSLERVRIIRIDVEAWSGKARYFPRPCDKLRSTPDATLIVIKDGEEKHYTQRGVADLLTLVKQGGDALRGAHVIDKAIGKAAAALMILGGVKRASTPRISTPALRLLNAAGVQADYESEVPLIINRTQTDICPLERLCQQSDNPHELLKIIDNFITSKTHGNDH